MEVAEGIYRVDGVSANVYFVSDGEGLMVVDSGMPKNAGRILHCIEGIGYKPSSVSRIILTHCHVDHAGSAKELKLATNAETAIHVDDADFVAGKKAFPRTKEIPAIFHRIFSPFFKARLVTPDITLHDGNVVGRLVTIHTPGHTPGSICLYDQERSVLFVGDVLSFVNEELTDPHFAVDMGQEIKSIERISQLDFDIMLCGHGDPVKPDASEKVRQFLESSRSRLSNGKVR